MSEKQIQFELISPEARLVSKDVYCAEIPGADGMFGVLPGHSSMLLTLGSGVVRLYAHKDDENAQRIFIVEGFADVTGERCTVLAETAVMVDELDRAALERDLKDLGDDLRMAEAMEERERIRHEITLTKSKLHAVTGQWAVAG
ncbi:MAG: ATP synthase F1 subunit epsilon [Alphaproteobacteria bacterium]